MSDYEKYDLKVDLVDAGPAAGGHATSTSDECGSGNTGSDACSGGSGN
ncbi:FxLD family lanthipeptide [Frankia sp. CcI49]|nr:FxLD family lanthipeptide [Frankia sp. CcI49]